ncbi:transferase [Halarchaeum grantii]|uniref:Transferase n=1 Tax=Halarchaeum grantii TaxID=1193105 RepID=A0A830F2Z5_9EURY|nr:transfer complex protein [Halarchaeum grantii]GGL34194.1 transferase [Halarchaeum grantii]
MIDWFTSRFRDNSEPTPTLPDVATAQQTLVTPSVLDHHAAGLHVDDTWTRTLWIGEFPDAPIDGFLESLYADPTTRSSDIALHVVPRDTERTLDALENHIEELEADVDALEARHRAGARGIQQDLTDYQELYDALRNTTARPFDVSMYLTTRAEDPESLNTDAVAAIARRTPANLTPVTPRWSQLDAFVSASPLGDDTFGAAHDATTPMLSGAIGAMFPFVTGSFAEPGVEYGTDALTDSPIIVDRFNRDTGYCMLVIGKLGTGKSFSTKLHLVRHAMYDPDTILVMLDPLEGFASVNDALGGERVVVGGTRGLNPLEIRATPPEVLDAVPTLDPWSDQITRVLAFFETFFEHVAGNPLGDRTQTLRRAIQEAYADCGITHDPETHHRESPTITTVIDVLEKLSDDPVAFGYTTSGEQESVRADARKLLTDLRPSFHADGDLAHLARPTELDLDAPVLYLDLHQEEGSRGRSETSLMMQVLFNAIYERAKETEKKVVFAIDEAHYLLSDASSLDFLETAVRHSRHYDLSLQFITQTGGEFTLTPEAKTIADLCSVVLIHRVSEDATKLQEWFGLSDREANWVRTAKAGNEETGFSEALLGIDEEGWFPLRVRATEYEVSVLSTGSDIAPSELDATADASSRARADGGDR